MKKIAPLACIAILAAANAICASSFGKLGVDFNARLYSNMVSGATEQSVLKEGVFHEDRLSLEYIGNLSGDLQLKSGIKILGTNDRLLNSSAVELKNYYILLGSKHDNYSFNIGDGYADFSPYVLGRNVKGLLGKIKLWNSSIEPVFGETVKAKSGLNYSRLVYGVKINNQFGERASIGLSYAATYDRKSSLSDDSTIAAREENEVAGINGKFGYQNLDVECDFAASDYKEKKLSQSEDGQAYRVSAKSRLFMLKLRGEYEVVGSSFNTLSGWANTDRSVLKGGIRYPIFNFAEADFAYETYHNNVNGYLAKTNTVNTPSAKIDFLFGRHITAFGGYKVRNSTADDSPRTTDSRLKTMQAGLNFILGSYRPSLTAESNDFSDNLNKANNYTNNLYDAKLRASFEWKQALITLTPMAGVRLNVYEQGSTKKEDTTTSYIFSCASQAGKYYELNLNIQTQAADKEISASDSKKSFWNMEHLYKIGGSPNKTISLTYSENEYRQQAVLLTQYKEKVLEGGVHLRF